MLDFAGGHPFQVDQLCSEQVAFSVYFHAAVVNGGLQIVVWGAYLIGSDPIDRDYARIESGGFQFLQDRGALEGIGRHPLDVESLRFQPFDEILVLDERYVESPRSFDGH